MTEAKADGGAGAGAALDLKGVFLAYCQFGNRSNPGELDNATFAKLAKETKLINKACTKTDIDLVFTKSKPKGGRKLTYANFVSALDLVSVKRFPKTFKEKGQQAATQMAVDLVLKSGGPQASGTKAAPTRFYDDKSTYTGVHKAGGPSTNDGAITLSNLMDRSASDARGRKMA